VDETLYTFRVVGPDYLVRGRQRRVTLEVYRSGALVAPTETGSTFSLWAPDEDLDTGTPLVTGAVTVVADVAGYTLGATDLDDEDYGRGWVEMWRLVLPDGTERDIHRPAAIVRHPLHPVVGDSDVDPDGSLARHRAPTITSWQTYLDTAWLDLVGKLEASANWPELVWSPASFRDLHKRMSRAEIYRVFARGQGGTWRDLLIEEEKQIAFAWRDVRAQKDRDQTGHADSQAMVAQTVGTVYGSYTPSTRYVFGGLY